MQSPSQAMPAVRINPVQPGQVVVEQFKQDHKPGNPIALSGNLLQTCKAN